MMVFQKHKNEMGQYLSILEYGAKYSKESVVIPEGNNNSWGWRGIYQKIQSMLATNNKGKTRNIVVDTG